jgi:HAD superfamily hydrolase (TIGR01509 family)
MIRAALFDVDGTLLDSNDLHIKAWQRAFEDLGIAVPLEALADQMGNGGERLVKALCTPEQSRKCAKALIERHVEIFNRDYLKRVRPFPTVRPLFERLREDGIRIALASSARTEERDKHVEMLGIGDLLDAATDGEMLDESKPCPDVFEAALARLGGIAPATAVVIGDSPYDMEAARRGGMQAIGVESGSFAPPRLLEAGASRVFRDVGDLLERYGETGFWRRVRDSNPRALAG